MKISQNDHFIGDAFSFPFGTILTPTWDHLGTIWGANIDAASHQKLG